MNQASSLRILTYVLCPRNNYANWCAHDVNIQFTLQCTHTVILYTYTNYVIDIHAPVHVFLCLIMWSSGDQACHIILCLHWRPFFFFEEPTH